MNIIVEHIQYLLRRHDCVIMPGIGAVIASHNTAYTDADSGAIMPPCRTLCFNASIRDNDGLLATSIARREGLSFEAAREKVEHLCTQMMQTLTTDRKLELDGIGTLQFGKENNIIFTPDASQASPLFYGLQPVKLPTLSYLQSQSQSQEQTQTITKDPRYFYLKLRKSVVSAAASVLIAMTIGTALWQFVPTNGTVDTASLLPVPSKTENVQEQAPKVVVKKVEPKVVVPAVEVQEPTTAAIESQSTAPEAGTYYLVVASTPHQSEIDKFMALHADDKSLQVVQTRTMIRVYSAKDKDRNQLVSAMRDADLQKRYPGAWIWQAPQ